MDIDILSQMIRDLILDFNEVTLPGMGTFVAEYVPSSISDKGLTINPPYRRLYFRQKLGTDTRLVDLYSEYAKLDKESAFHEISDFIAELKNNLKLKKNILLPGLGRLRATRENLFFFVSDEDLDICPESFGLRPVSMKAHTSEFQEAAEPALAPALPVEPVRDAVSEPDMATIPEPIPAPAQKSEPAPEPAQKPEPEPSHDPIQASVAQPEPIPEPVVEPVQAPVSLPEPEAERKPVPSRKSTLEFLPESEFDDYDPYYPVRRSFFELPVVQIFLIILALAVFALLLLAVLGRLAPDMIDPLLYNQEELQILRY